MTARLLKESEAWREIALMYEGGTGRAGLCFTVDRLQYDCRISASLKVQMQRRIRPHMELLRYPVDGCWAYPPYDEKYYGARATAALWLALEAEEEGK